MPVMRRLRDERGMVTAELAAALPILVILLAVALTAVSAAGQRVRTQDAAREAARAAARGDTATAQHLAAQIGPSGAAVSIARSGGRVTARVTVTMHPLGGWLPAMTVSESAVAAAEPDAESGVPP
jgi:Flp pilus assembly protein TadG